MKIGINTFGLVKFLMKEESGTLAQLKAAGVEAIEPCVLVHDNALFQKYNPLRGNCAMFPASEAGKAIDRLRAAGFEVDGCHIMGLNLAREKRTETLRSLVSLAKGSRLTYFVISLMLPSAAEAKAAAETLSFLASGLKEAGVSFLYHNHDQEFRYDGAETALDCLLREAPELGLQLDVGWACFAGEDPVRLMEKYRDRIRLIHFKDISADAGETNRRECFTAVGEGVIPLAEILSCGTELPLLEPRYVIDIDHSESDLMEDIRVSCRNIQAGKPVSQSENDPKLPFTLSIWSMPSLHSPSPASFANLCAAASRNGVRSIDLMDGECLLYGMKTVKHVLSACGLGVNTLILSMNMGKDDPKRIASETVRAVSRAKQISAGKLMIVPRGIRCSEDLAERKAAADRIIRCFRIAVRAAEKEQLTVCVEDTPDWRIPLSSAEECKYVLEHVPGLKLVYDTANMLPADGDPLAFYELLKEYITHVHLKDVVYAEKGEPCRNGKYIQCVPWGRGIIPIREIVQRLIQDGYQGTAMIEYTRPENYGYSGHVKQIQKYLSAL